MCLPPGCLPCEVLDAGQETAEGATLGNMLPPQNFFREHRVEADQHGARAACSSSGVGPAEAVRLLHVPYDVYRCQAQGRHEPRYVGTQTAQRAGLALLK
jgi:hypothetical protein